MSRFRNSSTVKANKRRSLAIRGIWGRERVINAQDGGPPGRKLVHESGHNRMTGLAGPLTHGSGAWDDEMRHRRAKAGLSDSSLRRKRNECERWVSQWRSRPG